MEKETNRIEAGVVYILNKVTELCSIRQMGLTHFKYQNIGEVFELPNSVKVHVMPGFEESIMVVRGASLVALSRSYAEPQKKNMIWKMKVRRNKDGTAIPHTKNHVITDATISKLPVIIETEASVETQKAANNLMNEYKNFRAQWKHKHEIEDAVKMVGQDLEGLIPVQADPDNGFKQERTKVVPEVPKELDI